MTPDLTTQQTNDFSSRLKNLDLLVKLVWALLAGAFCIGIWAAKLQLTLSNSAEMGSDSAERIRKLELNEARTSQQLNQIIHTVERIDAKITK